MDKITLNLWFDGNAEDAAKFYVGLFADSRIDAIQRSPADNPSTPKGAVLLVQFTLAGRKCTGINGGPQFPFTEAISLGIDCADQAEVDRLWDGLLSGGGQAERCGWLKDRYGVSWQIVPTALPKYLGGPDRDGARRAMQAMMQMIKLDIAGLKKAYEGG